MLGARIGIQSWRRARAGRIGNDRAPGEQATQSLLHLARKARPRADRAGGMSRARSKRSFTPGLKVGLVEAIQGPSVAQASADCAQRKLSKKAGSPSGAI